MIFTVARTIPILSISLSTSLSFRGSPLRPCLKYIIQSITLKVNFKNAFMLNVMFYNEITV